VQAPEEHGVGSKRSQARIPAAWEDRNCLQVADVRRGRGREPGSGQDPADRSRADAVPEAEEFTLDAAVPHRGFCLASRRTSSRISAGAGGRPVEFG
jgi:hypothetical protein